jgi:hypothetical protein
VPHISLFVRCMLVSLLIGGLGTTPASAQAFIFRTGVGTVHPQDLPPTWGAVLELYYYPAPHWGLGSDVGFWRQVETRCEWIPSASRPFCEDVRFQDVTVSLSFAVEATVHRGIRLFAGSGFGSHALEARSDSLRFGFGDSRIGGSEIRIGFQAFAGVDLPISKRWGFFLLGRYDGVADVAQWKAYGGLRLRFHGGPGRGPRGPLPPPEPEP